MALRVLLADESSTIKKVMQLALQDFGVEVKSVPIGLDVLQVCRSFQPDIVFVDILLAKKNGYEVSAELKADALLKKIPVVMMWSGFMELDESKARQAQIDSRLEKPFDADTLRELVKTLVPKLNSNVISQFLSFPEMPEFTEPERPPQGDRLKTKVVLENTVTVLDLEDESPANMEDLDEPEEFQRVPLPKNRDPRSQQMPHSERPSSQGKRILPSAKPSSQTHQQGYQQSPNEDWQERDLSRFKLDLPSEESYNNMDPGDLTGSSIALSSGVDEINIEDIDNPEPKPIKKSPMSQRQSRAREMYDPSEPLNSSGPISHRMSRSRESYSENEMPPGLPSIPAIDPVRVEEILRTEAKIVLENIAWKIIPDIVERLVREELHKLMRDAERL